MNPIEYNREGVGKAALLLLSLSPTLVSKILARLTRHEIQNLSDTIQRIDRRDSMIRQRQEELLDEFYFTYKAWEHLEVGRRAYALDLLRKMAPEAEAEWVIQRIEEIQDSPVSHFPQITALERLVTFIREEPDQTVALILGFLQPHRAAEVFELLPQEKQVAVMQHLVTSEGVELSPELLNHVKNMLHIKLSDFNSADDYPHLGAEAAVEILHCFRMSRGADLIRTIKDADPELGALLSEMSLTFTALYRLTDEDLRKLVQMVEPEVLASALAGASPEMALRFITALEEPAAQALRDAQVVMEPTEEEIEDAQQAVLGVARRLSDLEVWLEQLIEPSEAGSINEIVNQIELMPDLVCAILRFWMTE
jgi:flagellar motor switch protein FliG